MRALPGATGVGFHSRVAKHCTHDLTTGRPQPGVGPAVPSSCPFRVPRSGVIDGRRCQPLYRRWPTADERPRLRRRGADSSGAGTRNQTSPVPGVERRIPSRIPAGERRIAHPTACTPARLESGARIGPGQEHRRHLYQPGWNRSARAQAGSSRGPRVVYECHGIGHPRSPGGSGGRVRRGRAPDAGRRSGRRHPRCRPTGVRAPDPPPTRSPPRTCGSLRRGSRSAIPPRPVTRPG